MPDSGEPMNGGFLLSTISKPIPILPAMHSIQIKQNPHASIRIDAGCVRALYSAKRLSSVAAAYCTIVSCFSISGASTDLAISLKEVLQSSQYP